MPLEGKVGFDGRVARNVVDIVRREIELGPAALERERAGLADLLEAPVDDLGEANAELARRIRAGDLGDRRAALIAHLTATTRDKLEIANPRELDEGAP